MTIVITGAAGNVGRPLVEQLVKAGAHIRALTRRRGGAGLPRGVEEVPDATEALIGASAVFLNSRALGPKLAQVRQRLSRVIRRRLYRDASGHADVACPGHP